MKMEVDSESEELSEGDVSVPKSNILTRSVFNLTLDLPSEETRLDTERIEYEKRLNDEVQQWNCLMKQIHKDHKSATTIETIDCSILSPEKLAYLNTAPDLSKFVEESIEFRKEANVYLEVDYADFLELHENLVQLCKDRLDTKKSQLIEEYIFKIPKSSKKTIQTDNK